MNITQSKLKELEQAILKEINRVRLELSDSLSESDDLVLAQVIDKIWQKQLGIITSKE